MNLDLIKALYGDIGENARVTVESKSNDFADYLIIKNKDKVDLSTLPNDYYARGKYKYGIIISASDSAIRVQTIYYNIYKRFKNKKKKATTKEEFEENKKFWLTLPWKVKYNIELNYMIKRKKDGELKVLGVTQPSSSPYSTYNGWSTLTGNARWSVTFKRALKYCIDAVESFLYTNTFKMNDGSIGVTVDRNKKNKPLVYEKIISEKFIESNLSRLEYVAPRRKKKAKKRKTTKSTKKSEQTGSKVSRSSNDKNISTNSVRPGLIHTLAKFR